jgi:hypothetical protein
MGSGSKTTTNDILPWQKENIQDVWKYGKDNIMNAPSNIPTQQIAPLSGMEQTAATSLQGYDYGAPQYQQAQDIYSGIANMTPQDYASMNQQNMNPYQDQVIGASEATAARRRAQERIGEESAITQAGAFGSNRRDVYQGERQGAYEVGQNQVIADLLNQGYTQAQAATMAQLQNRSGAAGNIATGAANQGNQYLSGIQAQMGAGALERGIGQAGMDASYNQQMAQYEDPFKRFASMVGAMSGTPVASQQTETKKNGLLDYMSVLAGMGSKASGGGGYS